MISLFRDMPAAPRKNAPHVRVFNTEGSVAISLPMPWINQRWLFQPVGRHSRVDRFECAHTAYHVKTINGVDKTTQS